MHLIALHPDKQERAASEARFALGRGVGTRYYTKNMISRMPYLDAVVKESMRLYPVAPFVVRRLTSKISLPGDSGRRHNAITLPASTFACVWIYALHRRPDLWSHPDTFLPERWIDPALRDRGRDEPGAYLPFALGPRHCLGRPLATTALRVLLARILGRYVVVDPRLEALQNAPGEEERGEAFNPDTWLRKDMQAGFTVLPAGGLELQLVKRSAMPQP